jgi:hypothetical protein
MTDKINITVERGGEFHKFVFGGNCKNCSLPPRPESYISACKACLVLRGNFQKVVV